MPPWPDPDTAVRLSVEDLGMRLLHRVATGGSSVGRSNLIGLEREKHYNQYGSQSWPAVDHRVWEQRISEAFDWLISNGLLVRDASQRSDNWVLLSDLGKKMLAAPDSRRFFEAHKLLAVTLHPRIEQRVRQQFFAGEIESAVFVAVREVEIAVREAAELGKEFVGVKLMAAAFKPGEGPLHDPDIPTGEQAGVMALYTGLIGALKNPSSHRQVDFDDPAEAVEVVLFADLLLRMLDRMSATSR